MDKALSEQIQSRLKLDERNGEPPPVTQVAYYYSSDKEDASGGGDEDEDENQDENSTAEANIETNEVERLRKELEQVQAELDALPEGHKDTIMKLIYVADSMSQYHAALGTKNEEPFFEALRLATKAKDLADADEFEICAAEYYQATICVALYNCTKDKSYLTMGIAFCRESIEWWIGHGMREIVSGYTLRAELLSKLYQMSFAVEPWTEYIENAVYWQRRCVEGTDPDDEGEDGDTVLYKRYKIWVAVWVRFMDRKHDLKIDDLIAQVTERLPCSLDRGEKAVAHNYWQIRFGMYCRKWAEERDAKNFKILRENAKELLEFENNYPFCDCHSNKDEIEFSTNPRNPIHAIRRAAGFFDEWFGMDNEGSEWYNHMSSIDTSIALWEAVYKFVPRTKFGDTAKDRVPIARLWNRYSQKYRITKDPHDGWKADSKSWESSTVNGLYDQLECGDYGPTDSLKEHLATGQFCAYGESCVTGQKYSVWAKLSARKPWDLDTQRLKFLEADDGKWTAANWIRERSADGKFVLGGAQKGTDGDVLDFLASLDKPASSKIEKDTREEDKDGKGKLGKNKGDSSQAGGHE